MHDGGMKVQERGGKETQERGTGMQEKGPAGEERFALSRVSRVARALGGSWWPVQLPGPQGYYFLTAEPGLGPKGPQVRPRLSAGPAILPGDDGLPQLQLLEAGGFLEGKSCGSRFHLLHSGSSPALKRSHS